MEPSPQLLGNWSQLLRCPVCLGRVMVSLAEVACQQCSRCYPIVAGVPMLSVVDQSWFTNLGQLINYWYMYQKAMAGEFETDRLSHNSDQAEKTYRMMAATLESSLAQIDFSSQPLVADVGAGMCETAQVMGQRGAQVIATDMNTIDLLYPRFLTIGQPCGDLQTTLQAAQPIPAETQRFRRVQSDSVLLPFADDTFDVVFSRGTWHHYPNLSGAVAECARILKPNGLLVVCSEPLRAETDPPSPYLDHMLDFQEGIDETAPVWQDYLTALNAGHLGQIEVEGVDLVYGLTVYQQLSRWYNCWRKRTPGPRQGMRFHGAQLRKLHRLAGSFSLTARKTGTPTLSRQTAGQPLMDVAQLADFGQSLPIINQTYRHMFPAGLSVRHISWEAPVPRHVFEGVRQPESGSPPFAFSFRTSRFYLAGARSPIRVLLYTVPGQEQAQMRLTITINDQQVDQLSVEWVGLRELVYPVPHDQHEVAELRLEHSRMWSGDFPQGAPLRELGVGVVSVSRT